MIRVGIVVSQKAYERILEISHDFENKYKISYYIYKDFSEVEKICYDNLDKADAYIFGGYYIYHLIKDKSFFEKIPCFNFPRTEKEELFKLLLEMSIKYNGLDLSRTYIDCAYESNNYLGLKEIIPEDRFPYTYSYPIDEHFHQRVLETHLGLWGERKTDRSITRSGIIFMKLKEAGVPAYYLFPSNQSIIDTFSAVANHFKIKELDNNQIAIGHFTINTINKPSVSFNYESETKQLAMYQAIINFFKTNSVSNIIQKYSTSYEIIISKGSLREITVNYSHCALLGYLKKMLQFKISIGWGLGSDITAARQNAQYANLESERQGGDCSFVVTEQNHVIGPLGGKDCLSYKHINNSNIDSISKKTKLSPVTIQKLIGVIEKLNSNELSASDIAYYLGITARSANRIISKLEQGGNAVFLYTKSDKLQGRPKKVYSINLVQDDNYDTN